MYLTVKQAAERLQVSTKTVFRRIKDGSIPVFRLGNRTLRIAESDLQEYIDRHKSA